MRPDSGHCLDDESSNQESISRGSKFSMRPAYLSLPPMPKEPAYMPLIKCHPWYTDPEGIAITLGTNSVLILGS